MTTFKMKDVCLKPKQTSIYLGKVLFSLIHAPREIIMVGSTTGYKYEWVRRGYPWPMTRFA